MTEMKFHTSMRTVTNYKNENVYNNLMEKIKTAGCISDDIKKEIIEQYDKGNLTFREFEFLNNKLSGID
ncbi:MAG: hypothetical protein IJ661_07755 [Lachnospiraceae bacterium]|nr:hypothetical protein [Lachnospiraceae bacterium]